ncbi:MAG: hypothetical protein GOP50_08240 [Candidatus Heimdallarchaeota archaeon]|nr:hypothetical protein [Candidatus Heimdallarchaeota archaeon]
MGLRVFSIRRDGSYKEVPAKKESFLDGNGAYLIMDRIEKKIFIYRKDGISNVLSYSAGRAATNLKTMKGSKYNVVNIEHEERDRILPEILRKMESEAYQEMPISSRDYLPAQAYVYGEKTLPASRTIEQKPLDIKETREFEQKVVEVKKTEEEFKPKTYDVEDIVKTLASKILFESNIKNLRNVDKPPRHKLKSELVKKIDDLLDKMYD